jgi:hypothetical protein
MVQSRFFFFFFFELGFIVPAYSDKMVYLPNII